MEKALTARDKNDIFWIKKRRYMVSSDVKSKAERGYFNPDMVAEIRSAYDRIIDRFFYPGKDAFRDAVDLRGRIGP